MKTAKSPNEFVVAVDEVVKHVLVAVDDVEVAYVMSEIANDDANALPYYDSDIFDSEWMYATDLLKQLEPK
jgi:hypothetical protein